MVQTARQDLLARPEVAAMLQYTSRLKRDLSILLSAVMSLVFVVWLAQKHSSFSMLPNAVLSGSVLEFFGVNRVKLGMTRSELLSANAAFQEDDMGIGASMPIVFGQRTGTLGVEYSTNSLLNPRRILKIYVNFIPPIDMEHQLQLEQLIASHIKIKHTDTVNAAVQKEWINSHVRIQLVVGNQFNLRMWTE
jgi:hypothetical protein